MKTVDKSLFGNVRATILYLVVAVSAFAQTAAADWVSMPPENLMPIENRGSPLATADVYEVAGSLTDTAVGALSSASILPISEATARKYTGGHFISSKGKKPFLIRALYIDGVTGEYLVYKLESDIWVMHGCLNTGLRAQHQSALVVNLDFVPKKVYVTAVVSEN